MMRGRVRAVRHRTVRTVSDHLAYVVTFRLSGGEYLTIGTLNLSVAAARRQPEALVRDLAHLLLDCDVVCLQEAGQARGVVERAARAVGAQAYFGDGTPAQAATPVLTRRGLGASFGAHRLTGRARVGRAGAGPATLKAKFLVTATFRLGRDRVRVGNMHAAPSTYIPARWALARRQFHRAAGALAGFDGLPFLAGDLNQVPGARLLAPLRRGGLRSSQRALGVIPTMGRRAVDDVYSGAGR